MTYGYPCLLLGITALLLLDLPRPALAEYYLKPPRPAGHECGTVFGEKWTCQWNCHSLQALVRSGRKVICSRWGGVEVVCCPPPRKPSHVIQSVSQRKCLEYQSLCSSDRSSGSARIRRPGSRFGEFEFNKGPKQIRRKRVDDEDIWEPDNGVQDQVTAMYGVYNGDKTAPGEFPHSSLIGYGAATNIFWGCGGTLISEKYVMSAAHCSSVVRRATGTSPARWALLGDVDYSTSTDNAGPQLLRIIRSNTHNNYRTGSYYNDIVLFLLDRNVVFNRYVAPACLYTNMDDPAGLAIATGWGKTQRYGGDNTYLMKADLMFMPNEECNTRLKKVIRNGTLPSGIDKERMICAWRGTKDTCEGDSGGPLVLADKGDNCLAQVVGITSFGPKGCSDTDLPGVYVRVAKFIPWIESVVWPEEA